MTRTIPFPMGPKSELPEINAGDQDLCRVSEQAWTALKLVNDPPFLFRFGGGLVRIEDDETGAPRLRELTVDRARHELARAASWYRPGQNGPSPALPPMSVVRDILADPLPPLPALSRIVNAPVFAADGTLQTELGFHPASKTFYAAGNNPPSLRPVSKNPSDEEMAVAIVTIQSELLGDFPFTGDSERAHAIGLLLLPFARDMIAGPTPLHLIEKPSPGTGASLLVECLTFPALGSPVAAMTEGGDEDEWRKRITARLCRSPEYVVIDNLRRKFSSAAVSGAITATSWEDRKLGVSETITLPVRCGWIATGNNPMVSDEIARRSVRIRLDARTDRPWLREGFRYPDIRQYLADNRGRLIWSALTLIQRWLSEGSPRLERPRLGMFERWSEVIGGILQTARIPGFLGNLEEFYRMSDADGAAWREFVEMWWTSFQGSEVSVSDLLPLAETLDLGTGTDRSQKTRLGKLLATARDRCFGQYRIAREGVIRGSQKWSLQCAE